MANGYFLSDDDVKWLQQLKRQLGKGGMPLPRPQPPRESKRKLFGVNESQATIPAYSICWIDDFEHHELRDYAKLTKPSTTLKTTWAVTGNRELDYSDNRIGVLQEGPYYLVRYDTGTPATGEIWGPKPGQFTLSKNYPGFRVVGIANASAKIMLAERVPVDTLLVKAEAKIATDSTGDAIVYIDTDTATTFEITIRVGEYAPDVFTDEFVIVRLNSSGEWEYDAESKQIDGTLAGALAEGSSATMNVDPGDDTVTVYDRVLKTGSADIASGKKVYASWFKLRKAWHVIQAECP